MFFSYGQTYALAIAVLTIGIYLDLGTEVSRVYKKKLINAV